MPIQFQNYAQAYANPTQTVARDRSQSIKDVGSAIDEMIAKSDLAKEKKYREDLLSKSDKEKLARATTELNTLTSELTDLQMKRFDLLQKKADIENNQKMQEEEVPVAGTSTDTGNTNKVEDSEEFSYGSAAL